MALFRTRTRSFTVTVVANAAGRAGENVTLATFTLERGHVMPADRGEYEHEICRIVTNAIRRYERRHGNDGHPTITDADRATWAREEDQP